MEYIKHIENGYIVSVQTNAPEGTGNCTEDEYITILGLVNTAPVPPEGYEYRLTEELEWVLCELPKTEEAEATEEDYQESLREMGVSV